MKNKTLLIAVVVALLFVVGSLAQKTTKKPGPSSRVAEQPNAEDFVRRPNEPFEGEDDIEWSKQDLDGMIPSIVPWNMKKHVVQVPYKLDPNAKFSQEASAKILTFLNETEMKNQKKGKKSKKLVIKQKIHFKEAKWETYPLLISTDQQCAENIVKQLNKPNEIAVCLSDVYEHAEIVRAVNLGLAVNKQLNSGDSEEESEEQQDEKKPATSQPTNPPAQDMKPNLRKNITQSTTNIRIQPARNSN